MSGRYDPQSIGVDPANPESGERFRAFSGAEFGCIFGGAAFGAAAGGAVSTSYLNRGGELTIEEVKTKEHEAQEKLSTYREVVQDARQSKHPDAHATIRFATPRIKNAKGKIEVLAGEKPSNTIGTHADAIGIGALAGAVILTSVVHLARRVQHHRRSKS